MQTGKLAGSVRNMIKGQGQSRSPTLTAVRVESRSNVLKEIVFDGENPDQKFGVPDIYDGFEIPGISGIDTPSLRGVRLRTITRIPDGFRCDFNPQTGIWIASFGMKPPPFEIREDVVMGYWNASGFVLAAYGAAGMSIAQLGIAVHKHDVAICLGSSDGKIGSDTLRIMIVSGLSDAQKSEFLSFDNDLVRDDESVNHRKGHFYGSGSIKPGAAKLEPAETPAEKQSA